MSRDLLIGLFYSLESPSPDLSPLHDTERWHALRDFAVARGLGPLLAWSARPHLTGPSRHWCDRQLASSWDRHLRNLELLESAALELHNASIPAIPLKGSFLAHRRWSPPFLRKPCIDIDLAVQPAHVEPACAALLRSGFRLLSPLDEALRASHHVTLRHPSGTLTEIHFRLSGGSRGLPVEDAFTRAVPCHLPAGCPSFHLEHADELLQLTLHHASHRFESLFHFCELHRLWNAAPLLVRELAIERGIAAGFAGAIALTDIGFRLHWKQPFLPASVQLPRTWLHWRLNERLYRVAENWLTPGRKLGARLSGRLLDLQMTDRPADALRWFALMSRVARVRLKRGQWGTTLR